MPSWLKCVSAVVSSGYSGSPQLLLISVAFFFVVASSHFAASSSAAYMLLFSVVSASTSRILHSGQAAETISRSSDISRPQFSILPVVSLIGYLLVGYFSSLPSWLTFLKHPFTFVHSESLYSFRYTFRSASAFGSSYASTIATVCPDPPVSWML